MLKDTGEHFVLALLGTIPTLNTWRAEAVRKDYLSHKRTILGFFKPKHTKKRPLTKGENVLEFFIHINKSPAAMHAKKNVISYYKISEFFLYYSF